jgi:hypothetical protein
MTINTDAYYHNFTHYKYLLKNSENFNKDRRDAEKLLSDRMDPSFVAIVESYSTLKGKFDLICSVYQMNNDSMIDTLENEMESLKLRKGMITQETINHMPYLVLLQTALRNRILPIHSTTFTIATPSTTVQNPQKTIAPASDKM